VVSGRRFHLGVFPTISDASASYAAANKKHYGEFGGL